MSYFGSHRENLIYPLCVCVLFPSFIQK